MKKGHRILKVLQVYLWGPYLLTLYQFYLGQISDTQQNIPGQLHHLLDRFFLKQKN